MSVDDGAGARAALSRAGYVVPRYRAAEAAPWYHALHGNVPDHEIDFIYCPEVPDGPLTRTHFGHLARLLKYIEPRTDSPFAFAIGNLSRDDTQHEPGHGGVALVLGFRVSGVMDGAGRQDPPFAHAVVAIDRDLRGPTLLDATLAFLRFPTGRVGVGPSPAEFYRAYARCAEERPDSVPEILRHYVDGFGDLPALRSSALPLGWEIDERARPGRIAIVHPEDEPFENIARAAARLAAVLYRSTIRWTSIVSGGEVDIPGGLSIQFVPRPLAGVGGGRLLIPIEQVPEGEAEIAWEIFGARPAGPSRLEGAEPEETPRGEGLLEGARGGARREDDDPTLVTCAPDRPPPAAPAADEEDPIIEVTVDLEDLLGRAEPAAAAVVVEAPARAVEKDRGDDAEIHRAALGLPSRGWRWVGFGLGVVFASAAFVALLVSDFGGPASPSSPLLLPGGSAPPAPPAIPATAPPPAIHPKPDLAPLPGPLPARPPGSPGGIANVAPAMRWMRPRTLPPIDRALPRRRPAPPRLRPSTRRD